MKILQVVTGANEIAGVQRHAAWLAKGSKHTHEIAVSPAPKYEEYLRSEGVKFHVFQNTREFLRIAKKFNPDVLHAHLGKAVVSSALYKKLNPNARVIYSQHILYPQSAKENSIGGVIRRQILRMSYSQVDRIVAVSQAVKDEMIRRGEVYSTDVILNGVPHKEFKSSTASREHLQIIGISRMQPEKRPADFIEVAKRINDPRVKITVYGTGDLLGEMQAATKTLNTTTTIEFAGFRNDIENAIAASHIFLHFGEEEACPLAIIEALSGGLPVFTLALGGNVELVPHQVGRLFAVGEFDKMAKEIRSLANDPERLQEMSNAARQWSSKFKLERMISDIDNLYDQLGNPVHV